ncbi:MAG: beta-galactosidase [Flammeovirgaceae bacterium]|nr:beta-galactosidase [Flammeovirgaceae bacterium]MBE63463.1 beta-galactosidase [Flammeovirgaceae bacterium]HCX21762.1 beta-galactosidase [Cytophagales bacterium]
MLVISAVSIILLISCSTSKRKRERISLNDNWAFMKYASIDESDTLIYDVRPNDFDTNDDIPADSKPTEAVKLVSTNSFLKPWILPSGNEFIKNTAKRHIRPNGNPGNDFEFVRSGFDDSHWESVTLPHDWAIKGPFYQGWNTPVGGGMGRLPSPGIAWYRKKIYLLEEDKNKSIFLDIDGAMSYTMVWVNEKLAGGWPYGYSSFRIDMTPYLKFGEENQIAIRLDNPPNSSRWYPGGGIYRNVWLIKTDEVHIAHWGTFVTTPEISEKSAVIDYALTIQNKSNEKQVISVESTIYSTDDPKKAILTFSKEEIEVATGSSNTIKTSALLENPKLWGPPPSQKPNRYFIRTFLKKDGVIIDEYITSFGIREIIFDPNKGVLVNGEPIYIKGVNQHHDLGAIGTAWNKRAAERQLETLKELGCNAIRFAHNPPAPELLDMTDSMGFLVIDELYDCWERKKTPLDFHLIFSEWHEQDLRALVRRDRNHPSVILWSTGNEVGEQYTGESGTKIAAELRNIVNEEDPTRPTSASFNYAKPHMPITSEVDVINLNYQGEGIRNAPAYAHLDGINTPPLYPAFHKKFPNKTIISSENAAALSSRGTYLFPVVAGNSAPITDSIGGNPQTGHVSSYELHTANFGSSADKVFRSLDMHPYVAGGFVWSGWDYLGEPTPYYSSRSSYFGLIDLAGFKKDRFYLYQAKWRPDLKMAHILPHWNWPERIGQTTPVHVFTSGDEAELFLNDESMGRKKKGPHEYRLRWDDVVYQPGTLKVVSYKKGEKWAEEIIKTSDNPSAIVLTADRAVISADGKDLSFVTAEIVDLNGIPVPNFNGEIQFDITGAGTILATDNGDPTDMTPFPSPNRKAFNGKLLLIVKSKKGISGDMQIKASSAGLKEASIIIQSSNIE